MKDEFRILRATLNEGLTISGNIEPIKDLDTIGSGIIFDHHTTGLKDFAMIQTSGKRTTFGSGDHNAIGSSVLSSIYGGFDNNVFVRLESSFRAIEEENKLLRTKFVRESGSTSIRDISDRDAILDKLDRKIS